MSVIRKLPYIEELLASMSDANLKSLHTILNTGGNNVSLSFATLTTSYKNKVTPVYFQLDDNNVKTGILIYTNTMCALICYHKYQDLLLIKLNVTNHTYEKVNEYCDINELRRILDDTFESKGQIESGDAAEGTVPIADGSGGTVWGKASSTFEGDDIESGNAIALLGIDSNGDLVKDTIPEGIVVDETLDGASTNAVSNQAVVGGLNDVKDMIAEEYDTTAIYNTGDYAIYNNTLYKCKAASVTGAWDATKWDAVNVGDELNNKANKDGNYPTMSVGEADVAKNIKAYSDDSGALQENPFISQGTGTNNNVEIVTTGDYCEIKSKNGNTVVVSQLNNSPSGTIESSITQARSASVVNGHKYLLIQKLSRISAGNATDYQTFLRLNGSTILYQYNNYPFFIYNANATDILYFGYATYESFGTDVNYEWYVIDLTQMFNGNIPQDLLDNPSHFSWYYNGDLSYGSRLVNANGRYLECGQGRNVWDEETVVVSDHLESKNYTMCIPGSTLYFKSPIAAGNGWFWYDVNKELISTSYPSNNNDISVPSNAYYFKFALLSAYGTTYNHDITISLYYTPEQGGENYGQHYDYVAPKVIDTGSEELLAFDKKTPDGTIYHNTGSVDLSTLEWTYNSTYHAYISTGIASLIKRPADSLTKPNAISNKYDVVAQNVTHKDGDLYIITNGNIWIQDTSQSGDPTGTLQYELATPTTSQGTPFSAYPDINDYSYMLWKDTDNALVEIPQGASIFYPVNYAGTLDDLVAYVDGDVTNLAKKSDLTDFLTQTDLSANVTDSAGLTYLVKKLVKTGNVYTLTLRASNSTGATITAGTTLFTLPSGAYSTTTLFAYISIFNSNNETLRNDNCVLNNNGNVFIKSDLTANENISIVVSYAIA